MGKIIHGDALAVLKMLPDHSVDAICCDPPSGISFMGKAWDHDKGGRRQWIAWLAEIMREALRVLKPGGHALVWSLPRTAHWTATALEDAGFEIRDAISHVFGSGFPKSLDVSKAIDRLAGIERQVLEEYDSRSIQDGYSRNPDHKKFKDVYTGDSTSMATITAPATPEAEQWNGWGSALKPAHELWWLARAPLSEPTIAANVLRWGTGVLNIDASRIEGQHYSQEEWNKKSLARATGDIFGVHKPSINPVPSGRWPSNFLLSHSVFCTEDGCVEDCPVKLLDEQSGIGKSGGRKHSPGQKGIKVNTYGNPSRAKFYERPASEGGASRYFATFYYSSKASPRERNAGCEALPERNRDVYDTMAGTEDHTPKTNRPQTNNHPTVKPQALLRYFVKMICPPSGTVLDMFAGSGSTALACIAEGFDYLLIEQNSDYVDIARARIAHAEREAA